MKTYSQIFSLSICLIFILGFASCRKEKVKTEPQKIQIEIVPGNIRIYKTQTFPQRLAAKQKDAQQTPVQVKWTSSNPNIATVSSDGFVTGRSSGQTEIMATMTNGAGTATIKVVVYDLSDYKFRIELKDKGPVNYSLTKPQEFLSARTIERRAKYGIPIDSADIPISKTYLTQIENAGAKIVVQNKWLSTVSVLCSDSVAYDKLKALPFVKNVSMVWMGLKDTTAYFKTLVKTNPISIPRSVKDAAYYGTAWDNININKGQVLHDSGFKGSGMEIAVMDVGFYNFLSNPLLKDISLKGAKSFIYETPDPYAMGNHGVYVTSCMATNQPNSYVGTAPGASYWLFATEDENSEYPIEEDYWVAALEYADSAGVFIANTSLVYKEFDKDYLTHSFSVLDGKTTQAAKGAALAVKKGMLLVVSAGNDQSYVGTPADGVDVLTIGAVERSGNISSFSSKGMTTDGRIKPDVCALGTNSALVSTTGTLVSGSGTSFAGPTMCGMIACLWQAFPKLSNKEIINTIKQSADRFLAPALPFGYGIPDMEKAMAIAKRISDGK